MALKKKTQEVDVKTDEAAVVNAAAESQPANEAAPTQESEAVAEAAPVNNVVNEVVQETVAAAETELVTQAAPVNEVAPVTSSGGAMTGGGGFIQGAADDGFEGLELGYFSFPTIKLPSEGRFESSTGLNLGEYFDVVVTGSKSRYLIKVSGALKTDKRIAFSMDKITTIDGKSLEELKREWEADSLDIKKYLDVPVRVVSCKSAQELEGGMVMLSIPPSGVQRFSGYIAELSFLGKGKPDGVVTRCKVGPKITTDGNGFYPWLFEFISKN